MDGATALKDCQVRAAPHAGGRTRRRAGALLAGAAAGPPLTPAGRPPRRFDLQVQIELWVLHLVRKPTFKVRRGGAQAAQRRGGLAAPPHPSRAGHERPGVAACPAQGRVTVPLQEVIERKRWRDTWPLEDAAQGTLTMELSWMGALAV